MQSTDRSPLVAHQLATKTVGDPNAPHLVLVHGFTQTGHSWHEIIDQLSDKFQITTVDLPGHGESATIRAQDLDETAQFLGETTGRSHYLGYSLGGRVVLTLATKNPQLFDSLILVSASPGIADDELRVERQRADHQLADRLDPQDGSAPSLTLSEFFDEWFRGPLFAHIPSAQLDRPSRLTNTPVGLAHSLRSAGVGTMVPLQDQIANLAMPVYCIAGGLDLRYSTIAQQMCQAIGENAQFSLVEGVGHAVPFEAPDQFSTLVSNFLLEQDS